MTTALKRYLAWAITAERRSQGPLRCSGSVFGRIELPIRPHTERVDVRLWRTAGDTRSVRGGDGAATGRTGRRRPASRSMLDLLTFLLIGVLTLGPQSPALAAHTHYGETARKVAREIHCKNFRRTGGGEFNKDAGICWLKGKRVNVITFRGPGQQRDWNAVARYGLPSNHWWANGEGALVTARNGNKPAARIGARRLPGVLKHG